MRNIWHTMNRNLDKLTNLLSMLKKLELVLHLNQDRDLLKEEMREALVVEPSHLNQNDDYLISFFVSVLILK